MIIHVFFSLLYFFLSLHHNTFLPTAISLRYNGLSVVYLFFLLSVPLLPSPDLATMKGK